MDGKRGGGTQLPQVPLRLFGGYTPVAAAPGEWLLGSQGARECALGGAFVALRNFCNPAALGTSQLKLGSDATRNANGHQNLRA